MTPLTAQTTIEVPCQCDPQYVTRDDGHTGWDCPRCGGNEFGSDGTTFAVCVVDGVLTRNAVHCKVCDTVIGSGSRHDCVTCGCPNRAMVDGGYDCARWGAADISAVEPLHVYRPPAWLTELTEPCDECGGTGTIKVYSGPDAPRRRRCKGCIDGRPAVNVRRPIDPTFAFATQPEVEEVGGVWPTLPPGRGTVEHILPVEWNPSSIRDYPCVLRSANYDEQTIWMPDTPWHLHHLRTTVTPGQYVVLVRLEDE